MTIYCIKIKQVGSPDFRFLSGSHSVSEQIREEFYASETKANARVEELRNAITTLLGYEGIFEIRMTSIEVIE